MVSAALSGRILRKSGLKQQFPKYLCLILVSLLLVSSYAMFPIKAARTLNVQTVDSSGQVGLYASLTVDSSNKAGISYYDSANNDLKYAAWTGASWDIQTIDSMGFVGLYTSIAFDYNNNPCISYYGDNALKYASWNGSGWGIQKIDSGGGSFTSLALDTNGNPHISCFSIVNGSRLKYAEWTNSSWSIETADSAPLVGEFTSIALDANGNPHISYYDIPNGALKYAWRDNLGWNIQTVDSTGDVGKYTSLALDSSDNAHISYYDVTNGDLKFAQSYGAGWDIQVVDSADDVGAGSSLTLDSSGKPHISYINNSTHCLKYAWWNGLNWTIQTLNSARYVGAFTSLAIDFTSLELDRSDNAHIAFCDVAYYSLKYAFLANSSDTSIQSVQTTASLNVEPNPVGVGQIVWIHKTIAPFPPTSDDVFHGYTLTITKPDGTVIVEGPYASGSHSYLPSDVFKPDMVGTYTLRLSYSGEYFASQDVTYLSALSPTITLTVQAQPVPKKWIVDYAPSQFADFSSIQAAINWANSEDTVYVRAGTYNCNIVVNKAISLIGENASTTLINGSGPPFVPVVAVNADNVSVTGFMISGFQQNAFSISASYAKVSENIIATNGSYSIYIANFSHSNTFYHNNFMDSAPKVVAQSPNVWDNGYPSGGNYWSDYNGTDANNDGIGDTPYLIGTDNSDKYPLMNPSATFEPSPSPSPNPFPTPLPPQSPPPSLQAEEVAIIQDVIAFDLAKYTVTSEKNEHLDAEGLTIETNFYTLHSNGGKITLLVEFARGKLMMIHMLDVIGPLYLTKPATSVSAVEMAQNFLDNYWKYTGDPIYEELKSTLDGVDTSKNFNKTSGNTVLEVLANDGTGPYFRWYYTANGIRAPYSKVIGLGFSNGFLAYFVDKWQLYKVGSTSVNISEKEAIRIALETAQTHSWSLKLNNDTFDAKNFGESNVRWTALIFDNSIGTNKPRNEDLLMLFPVWRVGVALDKWYGNMYGIEIDIWADNGEVRSVQEAWSMMPPPEESVTADSSPSPTPPQTEISTEPESQNRFPSSAPSQSGDKAETSPSSNTEPFPTTSVASVVVPVSVVGVGLIVFVRKRHR